MKLFIGIFLILTSLHTPPEKGCDPQDFEYLKSGSLKKTITDIEFYEYLKTIRKLEDNKCVAYVQTKNGEEYVETGLTYLFGQICLLANSERATKEYINYLKRSPGSAEEQRSFSFEVLFVQNPRRMLDLISYDTILLDHLAWGFMNNRWYGVKDPYEKDPNKAYTRNGKEPKRFLNSNNYQDIFYKVYPSLKPNYDKYKKQIDFLLKTIKAGLIERKE